MKTMTIVGTMATVSNVVNDNDDLNFEICENAENNNEDDLTDHRRKGSLCCTRGAPFWQLLAIS